jgi:hypothetical protein
MSEPVATKTTEGITLHSGWDDLPAGAKLYIERPWVGLTDEEIITAYQTSGHKQSIRPQDVFAVAALARAIEAKLKEKNT